MNSLAHVCWDGHSQLHVEPHRGLLPQGWRHFDQGGKGSQQQLGPTWVLQGDVVSPGTPPRHPPLERGPRCVLALPLQGLASWEGPLDQGLNTTGAEDILSGSPTPLHQSTTTRGTCVSQISLLRGQQSSFFQKALNREADFQAPPQLLEMCLMPTKLRTC